MQTTNNCCINCDRQTAYCHTPIDWHTVKQRQTDRALYRHTTTLKPRDTHTYTHTHTRMHVCARTHTFTLTHTHTHTHTHTVLCGMPAKSVKYPTCSDACYTVKSNLTVTFHRENEKYPTLSVLTMIIICHKFSPKYKQYV